MYTHSMPTIYLSLSAQVAKSTFFMKSSVYITYCKQIGSSRSCFGYFPHLNNCEFIYFTLSYLCSNEFEAEKPRLGYGCCPTLWLVQRIRKTKSIKLYILKNACQNRICIYLCKCSYKILHMYFLLNQLVLYNFHLEIRLPFPLKTGLIREILYGHISETAR